LWEAADDRTEGKAIAPDGRAAQKAEADDLDDDKDNDLDDAGPGRAAQKAEAADASR